MAINEERRICSCRVAILPATSSQESKHFLCLNMHVVLGYAELPQLVSCVQSAVLPSGH